MSDSTSFEAGRGAPVPLADDPRTPAAAGAAATALGPVAAGDRIAEMDILRGFALLGIGVINLGSYLGPDAVAGDRPLFPAWYDRSAQFLVDLFGSGKFNAMFSILFGVGFAVQLRRASARGMPFAGMYLRRLAALFAFGVAHQVLLWYGDVLHIYAAIGVPLVLCRGLKDRWIWAIVAACLAGPVVREGVAAYLQEKPSRTPREAYDHGLDDYRIYGRGTYLAPAYIPPAARADRARRGETGPYGTPVTVEGRSTYPAVVADRVSETIREYRDGSAWFWVIIATTLLIGFVAGRRGIFEDIPCWLPQIRRWTIAGGVIGLTFSAAFAVTALLAPRGRETTDGWMIAVELGYVLGRPALCIAYMGALILMAQSRRVRPWSEPLALVGRMPLTNYLVQSVVFSTLFYGYAVGWYGRVGPALSIPIAFGLYLVQVAYSNWWMRRFRFGPMEWLWRGLTYGRMPAIRASRPT